MSDIPNEIDNHVEAQVEAAAEAPTVVSSWDGGEVIEYQDFEAVVKDLGQDENGDEDRWHVKVYGPDPQRDGDSGAVWSKLYENRSKAEDGAESALYQKQAEWGADEEMGRGDLDDPDVAARVEDTIEAAVDIVPEDEWDVQESAHHLAQLMDEWAHDVNVSTSMGGSNTVEADPGEPAWVFTAEVDDGTVIGAHAQWQIEDTNTVGGDERFVGVVQQSRPPMGAGHVEVHAKEDAPGPTPYDVLEIFIGSEHTPDALTTVTGNETDTTRMGIEDFNTFAQRLHENVTTEYTNDSLGRVQAAATGPSDDDDPTTVEIGNPFEQANVTDLRPGDTVRVELGPDASMQLNNAGVASGHVMKKPSAGVAAIDLWDLHPITIMDNGEVRDSGQKIGLFSGVKRMQGMGKEHARVEAKGMGWDEAYGVWNEETTGFVRRGFRGQTVWPSVEGARTTMQMHGGDGLHIVRIEPHHEG